MRKLLILICALSTVAANAEPVECPDGETITSVLTVFKFFNNVSELQRYLTEHSETGQDFSDTEAYSFCWRDKENNVAYCDVFVAKPTMVDGPHTMSVGHEVMHGVCGDRYHK